MSLRQEHTFTNPFAMRTGSTAHVAPALPMLQSLILRFAGANSGGRLALRSLPALALSLQLSLLPFLARRLGYSIKTGMLAWLLGLLLKPDLEERWESHLAGLTALLLTAAACVWLSSCPTQDASGAPGLLQPAHVRRAGRFAPKRDRSFAWAIATG